MRSLAAGGRFTVRLACAAASLLRPAMASRIAPAAATVTAAPTIAPRPFIALRISGQVIEPKRLYHAKMVNAKLLCEGKPETRHYSELTSAKQQFRRLRPRIGNANRLYDLRQPPENSLRTVRCPRLHEVDARMMFQNAHRPLRQEAAGAFPAQRRGMTHRAEALSIHPVLAGSEAIKIARGRAVSLPKRARRNFNVHAHADRCAPPGRDPGRGRQRKSDRGV